MKYMGSKRRIWKHIAPIILNGRKENQYYVEPFCGGCNSIANVNGNRIASDINPYLMEMWIACWTVKNIRKQLPGKHTMKRGKPIEPKTIQPCPSLNWAGLASWLRIMESFTIPIPGLARWP